MCILLAHGQYAGNWIWRQHSSIMGFIYRITKSYFDWAYRLDLMRGVGWVRIYSSNWVNGQQRADMGAKGWQALRRTSTRAYEMDHLASLGTYPSYFIK